MPCFYIGFKTSCHNWLSHLVLKLDALCILTRNNCLKLLGFGTKRVALLASINEHAGTM